MKKLPIIESYWVKEGQLLAGEYPGSFEAETTRRRMDAFLEAGITTFINLTEPNELPPYESILKEEANIYGVNTSHLRFTIRDYSIPSSNTMTTILNTIDSAMDDGRCVYVHCWGGVGRTGLVVGCYLVRHGHTNEQALMQVDTLFKTRPSRAFHLRSPESDEQVNFILNWWEDPSLFYKNNQKFCEG